jgi:ribulose 1,5-bisphosphate synthetase/thiazole synthase
MSSFPRRTLLKIAGGAAAAGLGRPMASTQAAAAEPAPQQVAPHGMQIDPAGRSVLEAPRRTPVAADVDVLVVGGGPTGVGAALASARAGARTLVVERHGMLGGVWTAGLLNPLFDFQRKGWIVADLIERLKRAQAWQAWKFSWTFDIEAMKLLLEAMFAEAKIDSWYYSFAADAIVEQGRLRGVIVESKSGRQAVLAKVVVDCTGDGDVAARAGVPYQLGRLGDSLCQPMTLMFEVQGVDGYLQRNTAELYDQMTAAIARHKLPVKLPFGKVSYAPWIINVPRAGAADVQATHVYQMNPLDTRDLTRATVEARRQADLLVQVMRHIPGLENVRLVQTAPAIGVREARHLAGRYRLDLEDLKAGRRFDDAVTFCGFGVDIHNVKPGERSAHGTKIRGYQIPYRCLVPESRPGLLFAGRCISGTHEAHASYRVTGTCMAMGQAAGLAAAMAAAENRSPDQLDGVSLRKALERRGVGLG